MELVKLYLKVLLCFIGELKSPSKAIPKGTIMGVVFTFCMYIVLTFFVAASSTK